MTSDGKVKYNFSTFSGVITPSVLAILGAVMYYITPKVVGAVGIPQMLLIIFLAHSITIATAFSIASITTNIRVKEGGLYFLVSRSLGAEVGGSIGIQLYLAQTVSVSFYTIAFSKAIATILADAGFAVNELFISVVSLLFFFSIVFRGANFVIKIQYFILIAVILSLISIFMGPSSSEPLSLSGDGSLPFWVAFTLFFPAVTGIGAGVGMSGDLKNPQSSIVRGTFTAIISTMLVYILLAIKIAYSAAPAELTSDPVIIHHIALVPALVILGVILATSSSALSSFMAAPRALRAMVKDNLLPKKLSFLADSIGTSSEPRIALIISLAISLVILYSGGLDFVATIVGIFFLNVYGWINAAAFFEKVSGNPSFRPSFNTHPLVHGYGMVACYFVMLLFNPQVMALGIIMQILLFVLFLKTNRSRRIEGVWEGILFQLYRFAAFNIGSFEKSKKNWRPTTLAFYTNEKKTKIISTILSWIHENTSITKMFYLVTDGDGSCNVMNSDQGGESETVSEDIIHQRVETNSPKSSVNTMMQSETIGNIPYNTVFLDSDCGIDIDGIMKDANDLGKNIIVLKQNQGFTQYDHIDLWWEDDSTGNLMLLLSHLIESSHRWKDKQCTIRVIRLAKDEEERDREKTRLSRIINNSRILNVEVIVLEKGSKSRKAIIGEVSSKADLVMINMTDAHMHSKKGIQHTIDDLAKNLTVTLFVKANGEIKYSL